MIQEFIEQDSYKAIDDIYKTILNVAIVSNAFVLIVLCSFYFDLTIIFICFLFLSISTALRIRFNIKYRFLISAIFQLNVITAVIAGVVGMGWSSNIWITLLGVIFINYFLAFNQRLLTYSVCLLELFVLLWLYLTYKDKVVEINTMIQIGSTCISVFFTFYLVFRLSFFSDAITSSGYKQISEEKEEIERISKYDFLTGLLNRRSIERTLRYELKELREKSSDANLVVMLGDIDNFKKINDTYGHDWGDKVLKEIARALQDTFRENDHICRWGGEEFLVILPEVKTEDVKKVETRLGTRIAQVKLPDKSSVTMTFGLVLCANGVITDIDTVINKADKKLYEGKKNGKDRIEYEIMKANKDKDNA